MFDIAIMVNYLKDLIKELGPWKTWAILATVILVLFVLGSVCSSGDTTNDIISKEVQGTQDSVEKIKELEKELGELKPPEKKEVFDTSTTKIQEGWDDDSPHID